MRYAFLVVGTYLLAVSVVAVRFKAGWSEGLWSHLVELALWLGIALALSKTVLRPGGFRRLPMLRFREIVIIISMVFVTIVTNASIQLAQKKVFGRTYISSYQDPTPKAGSAIVPVVPSVAEKFATNFVSVVGEEISSRWIILGALLMVLSPGWAIAISSLLFASLHTIIPILGGMPEVGLFRLGSTAIIGVSCGIAFFRYGLAAPILIHFLVNLIGWFAYNQTYIAKTVLFGSAFVALVVLPPTLWLTRRRTAIAR